MPVTSRYSIDVTQPEIASQLRTLDQRRGGTAEIKYLKVRNA